MCEGEGLQLECSRNAPYSLMWFHRREGEGRACPSTPIFLQHRDANVPLAATAALRAGSPSALRCAIRGRCHPTGSLTQKGDTKESGRFSPAVTGKWTRGRCPAGTQRPAEGVAGPRWPRPGRHPRWRPSLAAVRPSKAESQRPHLDDIRSALLRGAARSSQAPRVWAPVCGASSTAW